MKKNILFLIILSIMLQLGCTDEKSIDMKDKENSLESIEVTGDDKEIINRSENIADNVVELFGIDDATAIVFNDDVVVGIILSYDRELSPDIIDTIGNLIRENDSDINQVYITSDSKLFKQIDNMVVDILRGKPYDDYVANINKIIDKIKKEK